MNRDLATAGTGSGRTVRHSRVCARAAAFLLALVTTLLVGAGCSSTQTEDAGDAVSPIPPSAGPTTAASTHTTESTAASTESSRELTETTSAGLAPYQVEARKTAYLEAVAVFAPTARANMDDTQLLAFGVIACETSLDYTSKEDFSRARLEIWLDADPDLQQLFGESGVEHGYLHEWALKELCPERGQRIGYDKRPILTAPEED